ncbi:hypothetical protein Z950_1584 [Sulfitobacter mediterraneus KCTC 32188]|nr:hypothetical protein Z950_1584 [Sulfitobacter mediterraneus KCTC 32188]
MLCGPVQMQEAGDRLALNHFGRFGPDGISLVNKFFWKFLQYFR